MFLIDLLLDIIYPPRCGVCREIIPIDKPRWLCADCAAIGFSPITGGVCEKCGAPLLSYGRLCPRCIKKTHELNANYALFLYAGNEREIILNLKYFFGPPLMVFIKKLIDDMADLSKLKPYDLVIPVPIHKDKQADRGFNQAELLAKAISQSIGVPLLNNALIRTRNTNVQSKLSLTGRRQNIKDAFALRGQKNKDLIFSKAILLVDDIYTTGSTMNECAGVLLSNGAKSVNGFTFCVVSHDTDIDINLV